MYVWGDQYVEPDWSSPAIEEIQWQDHWRDSLLYMNIQISDVGYCQVKCREKVRHRCNKGWIWFGRLIDENCHGKWWFTFKCHAFKRAQLRHGHRWEVHHHHVQGFRLSEGSGILVDMPHSVQQRHVADTRSQLGTLGKSRVLSRMWSWMRQVLLISDCELNSAIIMLGMRVTGGKG